MRRFLLASFLFFLLSPAPIVAQRDSLRSIFLDAESWFLFEEYSEALPLYQSLLKADPDNDNLKYKIGICLLNDPYQKDKSIRYLLDASNNINPSYKENSLKERQVPPDVLYYLGNAYLVNELLELAIESYEAFLKVMDPTVYDEELVLAQIRSCRNAQHLKAMPVDMDLILLDSIVNTRYPDINPVISGDGSKLAFVTSLPFYDGAFYAEKKGDGWSRPRMITQMLGFDADVYPVALSYDGTEMILYYDDDYIGNLYYSRFVDGQWLPATRLQDPISTKYWESSACFSKDGRSLYFTSNRKGTHGGLDIYRSDKQADGKWGPPVNLGATINSQYNEECPRLSEDGQILFFSSYGHYNMGGYDIFYSKKRADGSWGEPVNMGYPINTTDDDLYFQPCNQGHNAYYALYSPRGIGRHDLYYMNIYSPDHPRLYSVTGNIQAEDGFAGTGHASVFVIDAESRDTIMHAIPDEAGDFALELKQGSYQVHYTGTGYEELIRDLKITGNSPRDGISLRGELLSSRLKKEERDREEALIFEGDEAVDRAAAEISPEAGRQGIRDVQGEEAEKQPEATPVQVDAQSQMDAQSPEDEQQLEVNLVYEDLLHSTEGILKEALEEIDLRRNRVSTVDELINLFSNKLEQKGMSQKEIEKTLADLFGDPYTGAGSGQTVQSRGRWPLLALPVVAVAGVIWFLIARVRRRKKGEKREE